MTYYPTKVLSYFTKSEQPYSLSYTFLLRLPSKSFVIFFKFWTALFSEWYLPTGWLITQQKFCSNFSKFALLIGPSTNNNNKNSALLSRTVMRMLKNNWLTLLNSKNYEVRKNLNPFKSISSIRNIYLICYLTWIWNKEKEFKICVWKSAVRSINSLWS